MNKITILAIESSCDDTSAAVIQDTFLLSNVVAGQEVHKIYGGVVPELASRAHQQNIVPVVDTAIRQANIALTDISAIAFTRGPGLMGSLLVGTSFAKALALTNNIPLIEVNHLHGHILSHFIKEKDKDNIIPDFPFLNLLVSGGHTQIVVVNDFYNMEIIGQTIDDAAGEAFDKCAKVLGLGYPGGPVIDKLASQGNHLKFKFAKPNVSELNFSFSGLKTSFLYFLQDKMKENPNFIQENICDLAASLQHTIIEILADKIIQAVKLTNIKKIAIGGGVAANSGLRNRITEICQKYKWTAFIPQRKFTTDNAAMIAITGYYKYINQDFVNQDIAPIARMKF